MGCLDSNPGFGFAVRCGREGSGGGLGVVGPAGLMTKQEDEAGCALIG